MVIVSSVVPVSCNYAFKLTQENVYKPAGKLSVLLKNGNKTLNEINFKPETKKYC